ncbi:MAG: hypothetical protein JXR77_12160 [Lentisphaeria bacterium]|nr:hypothetical protein [Lentisphaeria bacterium]
MPRAARIVLPSMLAGIGVLVGGAILLLAFVVPRTVAQWAEEGRALSGAERVLASASALCVSHGIALLAGAILFCLACAAWALWAAKGAGQ